MPRGVLARLSVDRVEGRLRDGTPFLVRPIGPTDRNLIRQGFQDLSEESRRRRFLVPTSTLTEDDLDYLTRLDYWDHFAWGAVRSDRPTEGMGVARYIRLRNEPAVAEAAVTVVDEYQRRGLGTYLLGLLTAAALTAGISTFRAYVLEENVPMRKLLEGLGARAEFDSPGILCMDIPLEPELMPDTPIAWSLKAAAAMVFPEASRFTQ
ncbi:MAG TPA: GNAT family N-acetyltransferase [Actinomycetota bacterium]|nr:GNAT family N-acetyltransferase [Actinomycetota bacterium]